MEKMRTALITGANKGLGFEIAKKLCGPKYNYKVILSSRDQKRGETAIKEILDRYPEAKDRLYYFQLDITDNKSVIDFYQQLKYNQFTIDCLINNAGIGTAVGLWKEAKPSEIIKKILDTNYRGHITLTSYLIPLLSYDAKIINIGSQTGLLGVYKKDNEV
jgi:short-subunit dehydrogenase